MRKDINNQLISACELRRQDTFLFVCDLQYKKGSTNYEKEK